MHIIFLTHTETIRNWGISTHTRLRMCLLLTYDDRNAACKPEESLGVLLQSGKHELHYNMIQVAAF